MRDFSRTSTTTKGKYFQIEWVVNRLRYNKGLYVGLVGHPEGLDRHIHEALAKGYSLEDIHFVEYNPATCKALAWEARKIGFPLDRIHCDDILNVVRTLSQKHKIGHVDADWVMCFGKLDVKLIRLSRKLKFTLTLVNSVRGCSKEAKQWAKTHGIRRRIAPTNPVLCYPTARITKAWAERAAGKKIEFVTYMGVSPMCAMVIQ